ncbi:hypothetical protein AAW01_00635 [Aurantiacibacter gangjinensis]|uniref:Uncharacterized protein n=1 Tax=Aurantiacibacter gangjinensis TaxID=502682 RepID=A0A0G9MPR3_9SPHN|nr:hypothetical protein AAW01_00635 [Aurantiacibacter gangjinensis]
MLGCLTQLATIAAAIAAGLGYFSFWWVLIPAFFAGSFGVSNGPHYSRVIEANARGDLVTFPLTLATYIASTLVVAGIAYWITVAVAS